MLIKECNLFTDDSLNGVKTLEFGFFTFDDAEAIHG